MRSIVKINDIGNYFLIGMVVAAVILGAVGIRLIEWPAWAEADGNFHDGAPLLPSADVYAWLAGAIEQGRMAGWPMSRLLGIVHTLSGLEPRWIAFWLPLLLAPVTGILVAAVCIRAGHTLAGLPAGIMSAGGLGYLARSRLGYADTDLFALPMAVAMAMACLAACRWLADEQWGQRLEGTAASSLVCLAGVFWAYMQLYPSGYPIAISVLSVMAAYAVAAGARPGWGPVLLVASILLLSGHFGWIGLLLSLTVVLAWRRQWLTPRPVVAALCMFTVLAGVLVVDWEFLQQTIRRVGGYTGLGSAPHPIGDWQLPQVDASIQETAVASLGELAQRTGSHWLLLLLGLAGFAVVLRRWPQMVVFLPLLALGLGSVMLGSRFAMYAVLVLGLGLGLGTALVLGRLRLGNTLQAGVLVLGSLALTLFLTMRMSEVQPETVLDPAHAASMQSLSDLASRQGRVWSWWDEGYPTQYYSELPTLADGGNASRQRIFMLGRVFAASEAWEAHRLMRIGARARQQVQVDDVPWEQVAYATEPLAHLTEMPAEGVELLLADRSEAIGRIGEQLPDEFLVVSWMTLQKAEWVSYFGRWRLTGGEGGAGRLIRLQPPVELDEASGVLHTADGPVPLVSLDILESGTRYANQWPRQQGAHAVFNNDRGEGVLMDSSVYRMMAVQMLIADPGEFAEHFELVSDGFPAARIYRARW